jgi:hypothetical protein
MLIASFLVFLLRRSETYAKLADSIYFRSPDNATLFVNLFASSEVTFRDGRSVQQDAPFPEDALSTTTITVTNAGIGATSAEWTVAIRVPFWATGTNIVTVNGAASVPSSQTTPSSYLLLTRVWKTGDTIKVHFPMSLRFEQLDDARPEFNGYGAIFYGPLMLAGLTTENTLLLANSSTAAVNQTVTRNSSSALSFEGSFRACGTAVKIAMIPFNNIRNEHANDKYTVYWYTKQRPPPANSVPTGVSELKLTGVSDLTFGGGASIVSNDGSRPTDDGGVAVEQVKQGAAVYHNHHDHGSKTHRALVDPLYLRGPSQLGGYDLATGDHYKHATADDDGGDGLKASVHGKPLGILNIKSGVPHDMSSATMRVPFLGSKVLASISFSYRFVVGYTKGNPGGTGAKLSLGYSSNAACPGNMTVLYASPPYLKPAYDACRNCYSNPVQVNLSGLNLTATLGGRLMLTFDNGDHNLQVLLPLNFTLGWK